MMSAPPLCDTRACDTLVRVSEDVSIRFRRWLRGKWTQQWIVLNAGVGFTCRTFEQAMETVLECLGIKTRTPRYPRPGDCLFLPESISAGGPDCGILLAVRNSGPSAICVVQVLAGEKREILLTPRVRELPQYVFLAFEQIQERVRVW